MASNYIAGSERDYSRGGGNPTWDALEDVIGALEGGTAVCFSSGMGAVDAVLDDLPPGAPVVHPEVAYMNMRANIARTRFAPANAPCSLPVVCAMDASGP